MATAKSMWQRWNGEEEDKRFEANDQEGDARRGRTTGKINIKINKWIDRLERTNHPDWDIC
jgi:hypothetical protein